MPKLTNETVKDGMVMGHVKTSKHGSDSDFQICSVNDWELMNTEDAEKEAKNAMFESGVFE